MNAEFMQLVIGALNALLTESVIRAYPHEEKLLEQAYSDWNQRAQKLLEQVRASGGS